MSSQLSHHVRRVCLVLVVTVLVPLGAGAQTIIDARRIEFTPSSDHSSLDVDGTAIVTSYSLQLFAAGGTTALQTVNLGKPALDTDGMVRADFVSLLPSPLTAGTLYEVMVSAVGPGGTGDSTRSNTFSFSVVGCTPTISPGSQSVAAAGGTGSSAVTAAAGCTWSSVSNATWISVTAGATGTASGSVGFSVAANTATTSRTGTLSIAGSTFTVTQAGACSYAISPNSLSPAAAGGTGSSTVTTTTGCAWTSVSNATWITVNSGASVTGSGSTGFTVAANTSTSSRTGTLTIAGKTFTVNQAGSCSYTVTPTTISAGAAGGTASLTVTTQAGCTWSSSTPVTWVALTASGTGSGTASYTVAANAGSTGRSATLTVAGKSVSLTQTASTKPQAPTNLRIVK
jgi:hypothetical protein